MEDGNTLFDYDLHLSDTVQLLVCQSLALPLNTKEPSTMVLELHDSWSSQTLTLAKM